MYFGLMDFLLLMSLVKHVISDKLSGKLTYVQQFFLKILNSNVKNSQDSERKKIKISSFLSDIRRFEENSNRECITNAYINKRMSRVFSSGFHSNFLGISKAV